MKTSVMVLAFFGSLLCGRNAFRASRASRAFSCLPMHCCFCPCIASFLRSFVLWDVLLVIPFVPLYIHIVQIFEKWIFYFAPATSHVVLHYILISYVSLDPEPIQNSDGTRKMEGAEMRL
ncbi:hypothetical protein K474DRAFT_499716 [Panus rudis PR-1116 ss-1]|nr:hypothetical protein K474DRAFT_499716 [Panus rudis PR-1116 ss-1]